MVTFRVRGIEVGSLDDAELAALLKEAERAGGALAFPTLYSLVGAEPTVDEQVMLDELARLAALVRDTEAGPLVGRLRDDLLEGVAASEEG